MDAALIGPILLDCSLNGTVLADGLFPPGNRAHWPRSAVDGYRYEKGAPNNLYPTSDPGHDAYCAISVLSEDGWAALKGAMGEPAGRDDGVPRERRHGPRGRGGLRVCRRRCSTPRPPGGPGSPRRARTPSAC